MFLVNLRNISPGSGSTNAAYYCKIQTLWPVYEVVNMFVNYWATYNVLVYLQATEISLYKSKKSAVIPSSEVIALSKQICS